MATFPGEAGACLTGCRRGTGRHGEMSCYEGSMTAVRVSDMSIRIHLPPTATPAAVLAAASQQMRLAVLWEGALGLASATGGLDEAVPESADVGADIRAFRTVEAQLGHPALGRVPQPGDGAICRSSFSTVCARRGRTLFRRAWAAGVRAHLDLRMKGGAFALDRPLQGSAGLQCCGALPAAPRRLAPGGLGRDADGSPCPRRWGVSTHMGFTVHTVRPSGQAG